MNANGVPLANNHLVYTGNRLTQETQTPAPAEGGLDGSNGPYRYDLSGYVTGHGNAVQFGYDAARNLTRCTRNGLTTRYVYDGHRRRVLKLTNGSETRSIYDDQDHPLYELAADGSRRNYVWLGDIPLAVIDQNAAGALTAAYAIETDFANTPRYLRPALPNANLSQPVWAWPLAPYGNAPAQPDPDHDGSQVVFNLRYPGQYYDAESGLHYNHTRYFSPRTGRYLQPDLIKLEGGVNVYTYANGNPVHFTDPTGTVWDFVDIGFFAQSLFNFIQQPGLDNAINLGLDGVGLLPGVPALGTLRQVGQAADKVMDGVKGVKPPNLSPSGAGRNGAFREAKRQSGVPVNQQPSRVTPNVDKRGNTQPGKIYEFDSPTSGGGMKTIRIRDDSGGHNFGAGNLQNRGPHFNDEIGNHYDY
ncbi:MULTISPECIES: RHS repeat-associated core domain-containing protein [Methylomicrobium]|uniref:RHS repeat-associated core domain-containing protein n=1 Tax=Methylomicrobium TaxID=39773 RepID=UPI00020D88D8|nr:MULTISPECIES: RHS repeat-associated core domain-containing protein [Methylomicrobium]